MKDPLKSPEPASNRAGRNEVEGQVPGPVPSANGYRDAPVEPPSLVGMHEVTMWEGAAESIFQSCDRAAEEFRRLNAKLREHVREPFVFISGADMEELRKVAHPEGASADPPFMGVPV